MNTQPSNSASSQIDSVDLLQNKWIYLFMRSRWYPGIIQWPTLIIFVVIIYQLMLGPSAAHDNLGTALTWVLWWPIIPVIFLFLGRFWCAICPFATVNDLIQNFVGHNRKVPHFLKQYGVWIMDASFILITWSDHVWGVVGSPVGSGVLLLILTTCVVASGAFFERRTFCRHVCFLGGLAGNYAQAGMLSLHGTPDICAKCTTVSCYTGTENAPGCPMFEFPRTVGSSANCVLCGDCIKNCPNESIQLTVRPPTKELWFVHKPKVEAAFLAAVIMGIVLVQNVTMLEIWGSALTWLESITGTTSYYVNFSLIFLVAITLPVSFLAWASVVATKQNNAPFVENFTRFGYAIIALDLAAHIAHNLFHMLAEGKSILYTGLALFGVDSHGASPALVSTTTIQIMQFVLIGLGLLGSLYIVYSISKTNHEDDVVWATFKPYAAMLGCLAILNIVLFTLPMDMRM
jgi:polyferredoxin